jgi:hypothetical protein
MTTAAPDEYWLHFNESACASRSIFVASVNEGIDLGLFFQGDRGGWRIGKREAYGFQRHTFALSGIPITVKTWVYSPIPWLCPSGLILDLIAGSRDCKAEGHGEVWESVLRVGALNLSESALIKILAPLRVEPTGFVVEGPGWGLKRATNLRSIKRFFERRRTMSDFGEYKLIKEVIEDLLRKNDLTEFDVAHLMFLEHNIFPYRHYERSEAILEIWRCINGLPNRYKELEEMFDARNKALSKADKQRGTNDLPQRE